MVKLDEYIAHIAEDGRKQTVREHLENVAELCEKYAIPRMKDYAYLCGMLHDAGKYTRAFQKRILENGPRCEHARYGAQLIGGKSPLYIMMQYCIAGHHAGLPDGGADNDEPDASTLHGLLKRRMDDISQLEREITYSPPEDRTRDIFADCKKLSELTEAYAFMTRYLFSCLTDADFTDTERFCNPDVKRGMDGDFQKAYERVCAKIDGFYAETKLQKARGILGAQVCENFTEKAPVYCLDMPTGSGKTLLGIKLALKKAIDEGKERIIYVIPYVSIIEQTAQIFKNLFGDVLPVLEHHSNFDFETERGGEYDGDSTKEKMRRSCENWDAKLIITTNVQFFESVYSNRAGKLRKLHNIANSIIIFDEAHVLPTDYILPSLRAIDNITGYLGSTAIMMSATMPDYSKYVGKIEGLVKDRSVFSAFDKRRFSFIGKISMEELAGRIADDKSTLVVVNSRKTARELYKSARGKKFHLSTYMTPQHRLEKIAEIKKALEAKEKITVVSTSLIEAGVDLDFDEAYRENTGLDSIIQTAGRVNREGRMDSGEVFVFELEDGGVSNDAAKKANIVRGLFERYDKITADECIKEYYEIFFNTQAEKIGKNSISENVKNYAGIPFRSYAKNFKFIDDNSAPVFIRTDENTHLLNGIDRGFINRRAIQRCCASVRKGELDELLEMGAVTEIAEGLYMLLNPGDYDEEIGLYAEAAFIL